MNFSKIIKNISIPPWLLAILSLEFLFRIPSFFEAYSYGDEMIYVTLGNAVRNGLTLYKDIHDNKPPMLYYTAALAGNLFWFKLILAVFMILATVLFWELVVRFYSKNTKLQIVSVLIFALFTTLPLLEGNIVNAELFMIGFSIAGYWVFLNSNQNWKHLFLSGILFSFAALFKIPAAFDMLPAFFLLSLNLRLSRKSLKEFFGKSIILSLGFAIPLGATFLWFYTKGALPEYVKAAFAQNVGYLSSFRPGDVQESFIVRNAPLLIRAMIVATGVLVLWIKKEKLSLPFLFASSWLLVSLFAVTLSERPYPHYLIQSIPSFSILIGIFVFSEKIEQVLSVIPISLFFLVPVYFKFYYYPSVPYYSRFFLYANRSISQEEYFNRFDESVERNYKIADFLKSTTWPEDRVFVWGDSPSIYALSKRLPPIKYTALYHITDFYSLQETANAVETSHPKFVVILPNTPNFQELQSVLNKTYVFVQEVEGAQIWEFVKPSILSIISG